MKTYRRVEITVPRVLTSILHGCKRQTLNLLQSKWNRQTGSDPHSVSSHEDSTPDGLVTVSAIIMDRRN